MYNIIVIIVKKGKDEVTTNECVSFLHVKRKGIRMMMMIDIHTKEREKKKKKRCTQSKNKQ